MRRNELRCRYGVVGLLWEILKAVGPQAAPHVARAVRQRQTAGVAERRAQAAVKEIARGFATIEERLAAAGEKAAAAEDRLAPTQTQFAGQWSAVRKWMLALLVWNAVLTAILIYVLVARR